MNTSDRDVMIRLALTPSADVQAPADLGDSIYREILRTPSPQDQPRRRDLEIR